MGRSIYLKHEYFFSRPYANPDHHHQYHRNEKGLFSVMISGSVLVKLDITLKNP